MDSLDQVFEDEHQLRIMAARTREEAVAHGIALSRAAWALHEQLHGPHPDADPKGVRVFPPLPGETDEDYWNRVSEEKFRLLYGHLGR